jgi:hypothetical protein
LDDAELASDAYRAVRDKIAAKWYTLEQEREQRAVQLEQHLQELRERAKAVEEKKSLVRSARQRYLVLAATSGAEIEPLAVGVKVADPSVTIVVGSTETEAEHDELSGRILRRLFLLRSESSELDQALSWWQDRTDRLQELLDTKDKPTAGYLRADARVEELTSQFEDVLSVNK